MSKIPVCAYCNSTIPWGEGLVLEGKWYEDKCYKQKLLKRKSELEKKYPVLKDLKNLTALSVSGKMSVDEANEYQDIITILTNLEHPEKLKSTYKGKPLPKRELKSFPINKIRFGDRVDTQAMIGSREIKKVVELNPENGAPMYRLDEIDKPAMNAIYAPSPEKIIPYTELKRIEGKHEITLIKPKNKLTKFKKKLKSSGEVIEASNNRYRVV